MGQKPPLNVVEYTRSVPSSRLLRACTRRSRISHLAWCEAMGAALVELVSDGEVSGTRLLAKRSGRRKVAHLLDSRRPRADAVVVVRMDRLGRDTAEQIALLKRFRTGNVGLVAIAEQIDLATPHGRAMAQSAQFSTDSSGPYRGATSEALAELRSQGRAWNHAPFGWDVVDDGLVASPWSRNPCSGREMRSEGLGYLKIARL